MLESKQNDLKIPVFWYVAQRLLETDIRYRGAYCLLRQDEEFIASGTTFLKLPGTASKQTIIFLLIALRTRNLAVILALKRIQWFC
jgi:hypothetical protein